VSLGGGSAAGTERGEAGRDSRPWRGAEPEVADIATGACSGTESKGGLLFHGCVNALSRHKTRQAFCRATAEAGSTHQPGQSVVTESSDGFREVPGAGLPEGSVGGHCAAFPLEPQPAAHFACPGYAGPLPYRACEEGSDLFPSS